MGHRLGLARGKFLNSSEVQVGMRFNGAYGVRLFVVMILLPGSRVNQHLYFFSTTKGGNVQQFHLYETEPGVMTHTRRISLRRRAMSGRSEFDTLRPMIIPRA